MNKSIGGLAILIGAVAVVGVIGLFLAVGQVDAGYRGVVTEFGAPTGEVKGEGIYMIVPFVQRVHDMSLQVDRHDAPADAASKDLQEVHTTVTVNFHLNAASVIDVYRTLRRDYEERIIVPAVQETVKATTAHFVAEELITERPRVKLELESQLTSRLAPYGIIVDAVSLTDFEFSEAFTAAIESKQVAVQRALESENLLRQIEVEARQAQARADGEKNATIKRAEGEQQRLILEANGQATANKTVTATITDDLIRYELVKRIGDDIRVLILPSGQEFILGESVLGPGK